MAGSKVGTMSKESALLLFHIFVEKGYAVSIKHRRGGYSLEIPVRLTDDPCYGMEGEIVGMAVRGGRIAVQTGGTLSIY